MDKRKFVFFICVFACLGVAYIDWKLVSRSEARVADFQPRYKNNVTCVPRENIVFIKVHKVAGTTISNVFLRYAINHNLTAAIPQSIVWLGWPRKMRRSDVLVIDDPAERYNIIAHHAVFDKKVMSRFTYNDTMYVGLLRHPWAQFNSAFKYYEVANCLDHLMNEPNPIGAFLRNPEPICFVARGIRHSIQNMMAYDLGLSPNKFNNTGAIQRYIEYVDDNLGLVMIKEYLMESLVLLRRYLCWEVSDILFQTEKAKRVRPYVPPATVEDQKLHQQWSRADYMFYDYFNKSLWKKIGYEGPDFFQEVSVFKETLASARAICANKLGPDDVVYINQTDFSPRIEFTKKKCWMFNQGHGGLSSNLNPLNKAGSLYDRNQNRKPLKVPTSFHPV